MAHPWQSVRVHWHAGHRGEEYPTHLDLGAEPVAVEIESQWREPDGDHYRLTAATGEQYELRPSAGGWKAREL